MKKAQKKKVKKVTYHASKEQKKRRAQRNKARRQAIREGRVKKYSKKDVHHKDKNTANNKKSNLRILSRKKNRSNKI